MKLVVGRSDAEFGGFDRGADLSPCEERLGEADCDRPCSLRSGVLLEGPIVIGSNVMGRMVWAPAWAWSHERVPVAVAVS